LRFCKLRRTVTFQELPFEIYIFFGTRHFLPLVVGPDSTLLIPSDSLSRFKGPGIFWKVVTLVFSPYFPLPLFLRFFRLCYDVREILSRDVLIPMKRSGLLVSPLLFFSPILFFIVPSGF